MLKGPLEEKGRGTWASALTFSLLSPGPGSSPLFSLLPGYRGHPSFQSLVTKLRSQVMSMARPQLSHTILTEKNWYGPWGRGGKVPAS